MSERAIRLFVPGFLLISFLIGFGRWITYQKEIYPFGAWGMFHRVNKTYDDYDLLIHRMGDRTFAPPARASEPDDPSGIDIDAHTRLVLNGWYRFTRMDDVDAAEPYREFIDRHVVGPDAEYEIAWILGRSRRDEQHRHKEWREGPFTTPAGAEAPDPEARFPFPERGQILRVRDRDDDGERDFKRKKSAS